MIFWKNSVSLFVLSLILNFTPQKSFASYYYPSEIQKSFQQLQQNNQNPLTQTWTLLSLLPSNELNQLKKQFTNQLAALFSNTEVACEKSNFLCLLGRRSRYREARRYVFGQLHLRGNSKNTYAVDDIYCSRTFTNKDFKKTRGLAPNQIPDHKILNTEHIWPQSHFSSAFPEVIQLTDLHILYPSHSNTNSQRGNHFFGKVYKKTSKVCGTAKIGFNHNKTEVHFEPPHDYKGNVARAMFYFSVRYRLPLSKGKQNLFKRWSKMDPVDDFEKERNNTIFTISKTRNPFIDQPESILYISDSWGQ